MKTKRIKSPTGCRPAQLFGAWMIEPNQFRELYTQAMRVDLVALGQANRAAKADSPSDAPGSQRTDIAPRKTKPYQTDGPIALLSLTGPMTKYETSFQSMLGGTSTLKLRNAIRVAMDDEDVYGAMIYIDSPGGTVDGTKALADDIAAFVAAKPCMGFIDGCGCSAAYWAASQCSMVYASPTSLVGSIGARMRLEDSSKQYAQDGVKVHEITTGPMKAAGAPGTEVTDEQIAYYQGIADSLQTYFAAAVANGRKLSPDRMAAVSDASVFVAEKAMQMGLVDRVSSQDDAMATLKNRVFFGPNFKSPT